MKDKDYTEPPKLEFDSYYYAREAFEILKEDLKMMMEHKARLGYFKYTHIIERLHNGLLDNLKRYFETKGFTVKLNFKKTEITISWGAK